LIPAGVLVTVPLPESATVNWAAGTAVNVAETAWLLESTILQDEPVHAPPKPAKLKPDAGVGIMVTVVPGAKLAVQVDGATNSRWVAGYRAGAGHSHSQLHRRRG